MEVLQDINTAVIWVSRHGVMVRKVAVGQGESGSAGHGVMVRKVVVGQGEFGSAGMV